MVAQLTGCGLNRSSWTPTASCCPRSGGPGCGFLVDRLLDGQLCTAVGQPAGGARGQPYAYGVGGQPADGCRGGIWPSVHYSITLTFVCGLPVRPTTHALSQCHSQPAALVSAPGAGARGVLLWWRRLLWRLITTQQAEVAHRCVGGIGGCITTGAGLPCRPPQMPDAKLLASTSTTGTLLSTLGTHTCHSLLISLASSGPLCGLQVLRRCCAARSRHGCECWSG